MRTAAVLILIFLALAIAGASFAYEAKVDIQVLSREIKVQVLYRFPADYGTKTKIDLPRRARFVSVGSPTLGTLSASKQDYTVWIDNVGKTNDGKVLLVYTMPVIDYEFCLDNWLPSVSIVTASGVASGGDCRFQAVISVPNGFTGLFYPYETKEDSGYYFSQNDAPVIICGKMKTAEETTETRHLEIYHQFKLDLTLKEADAMLRQYESMLLPLSQKNIVIIQMPSLKNAVRFTSKNIFLVVNSALPDEIRKGLLSIWFRGMIPMDADSAFALTDLYKRFLTDSGEKQTDDARVIAVPSASYYQRMLGGGFQTGPEVECDINGMLKNFALIHTAYYTMGFGPFQELVKKSINAYLNSPSTNLSPFAGADFSKSGQDQAMLDYIFKSLLPVARTVPDVFVKKQIMTKNDDRIPDLTCRVGDETRLVSWDNKRGVDLGISHGSIVLDVSNKLPQLVFYNDKSFLDDKERQEWDAVYQGVARHRHYKDESFRELMDLSRYKAGAGNAFNVPPDSWIYVAVVRINATIKGKFATALKEVVLTLQNGKPAAVYDRIRI